MIPANSDVIRKHVAVKVTARVFRVSFVILSV